ncbi:MAG: baseplate J/gp47 family protein [Desulfovibrio sp.]|jgi:uncharacterized phage protein gp47/JayE|nr:baseplate J/gp47 family protein [Desulfovibrio sp.]
MPFERPTLQTLVARACADIESRLQTGTATFVLFVRRQLLGVLGRMSGGLTHGLYGYLSWQALQVMPDTAEAEHMERWAAIWGMTRKPASTAEGLVICKGVNGIVIPAGTEFQRQDAVRYISLTDALVGQHTPGEAIAAVRAQEAGAAGNAPDLTPLQLAAPVLGVEAQARADGNITGGADAESDASLRARLLARIRRPPRGGAAHDYIRWALEVPGVTRAWCYPLENGIGTVSVRFLMDDSYPDGIPTPEDVARVAAYIDSVRPVTAEVYVLAPTAVPLDLSIRITPDTPLVRRNAEAAVWAALKRDAVPGGTILLSRINEAISLAEGEEDHVLLQLAGNVLYEPGQMPVPGVIDWGDPEAG